MSDEHQSVQLSQQGQQACADVSRILGITDTALPGDTSGQHLFALIARMDRFAHDRDAPVRELLARLGDRWSTLLLLLLRAGPFRHATLRRLITAMSAEGDISQRMLTLRLRALERDGMVQRDVEPTVPPRVTYSLTPMGLDLTRLVDGLLHWIEVRDPQVRAARQAFAMREADD